MLEHRGLKPLPNTRRLTRTKYRRYASIYRRFAGHPNTTHPRALLGIIEALSKNKPHRDLLDEQDDWRLFLLLLNRQWKRFDRLAYRAQRLDETLHRAVMQSYKAGDLTGAAPINWPYVYRQWLCQAGLNGQPFNNGDNIFKTR